MELIKVKVKLKSLSSDNGVVATQHRCEETTPVVATQLQLSDDNSSCPQTTTVVALQRSQPETYTQSEVQIPKTIKTLNTINTLSEDEREKFKAFCKRKADQLPTRVVLLDSWIKKHFEELHAEYQLVYGDKSSARSKPSITKGKNWEKVNAAMKTGELKDTYYSDLYKCDCVVLLNGTVIPLEEWVNAAGRKN